MAPGASVARVARAHGVNANQVFAWRRQYRQGMLGEEHAETAKLLPVHVSKAQSSKSQRSGRRPAAQQATSSAGAIHVEFPKGCLCITGRVDAEALRVVLEQLLG